MGERDQANESERPLRTRAKAKTKAKRADKLLAAWSRRDRDLVFYFPLGYGTSTDSHYLSTVLTAEFLQTMTSRGYDIETLKFEISPSAGQFKFASTRPASVSATASASESASALDSESGSNSPATPAKGS